MNNNDPTSFLLEDTRTRMWQQAEIEQNHLASLTGARVNRKDHTERESNDLTGEPGPQMLQHPDLESQQYDGHDPNLAPNPTQNPEAAEEYKREQHEKQLRKELQLQNQPENQPKFNPRPGGP